MSLEFTLVRRAIRLAVIDGPDSDDNPDILQAQGSVLFEPVIKKGDSIQVQTRGGSETYALAPIECPINDGIISHRGQDGVKLPAGGEAANPSLIRWKATFSRMQAGGKSFTLAPVIFDAVPGGEIDLTMVAPVAGAPEGVVRGPRGTSLESIIVDGSELVFTAVDDAGSFEIARIPLDDMVRAEAEAAADGVRDALAVDVAASQSARDAAEGHADRAASSASNAKTSETNAKQSETNAGDYAAVATTAATEAVDAMEVIADSNAVSRVEALEAMAGLSPESPVDGQTANLISQPDTLTRTAAENAIRELAVTVREAPLTPYRFGASEPLRANDHTVALRAMFEAAASSPREADIRLPQGDWVFKNSDGLGPLPLSSNLKVVGTGSSSTRIHPDRTEGVALFGSDSHIKAIEMRDFGIQTSTRAGHIFQTKGIDRGTFANMFFVQQLKGWSIWEQMSGDWIQNVFTSCEIQASATASVPWFNLESSQGGLNSNTFDKCRFNGQNGTGAPVFRIDDRAQGAQVNDWAFRDIILEQTTGGFIHASGASNWILDNVQSWDASVPHAKDILRFDTATGGGLTHNLTFRNYSRHGESLAAGVYDVNITNGVPVGGVATFINCNPTPYSRNHSINSPSNRTVYIATRGYSTHQSSGVGSPEGVILGSVGDMYTRTDGGVGTTLYVKESGERTTTGWVAK